MVNQLPCSLVSSIHPGTLTRRLLAALVLVSASFAVQADPVIASYDPSTVSPEDIVYIHGERLMDEPDANLCWGSFGRTETSGTIGGRSPNILHWDERTIHLRLPETMTEGTYWIGVCRGARLVSNRLAVPLRVAGVATAPVVTGYNPTLAAPGNRVIIHGRRFGTRVPGERIRFGGGLRPDGSAEVLRWADTEIEVRLPAGMRPGMYWLAIYRVDELLSDLNKGLRVGRIEEMTLSPIRRGTTYIIRSDASGWPWCGLDRRGLGGPSPTGWDNTQISVGGSTNYDPGTLPFPCWTWDHTSFQGAVLFDLSPLIAADRPLPGEVELRFRQAAGSGTTAGPCGTVFVFGANEDWTAGLQDVRRQPRGTLLAGAGRVGSRLSLPITEYVRDLIISARGPATERRRHYGFLFNWDRSQRVPTSEDSRRLNIFTSPSGCVGQYRDFSLHVRWVR
jgi:hypothetical protein